MPRSVTTARTRTTSRTSTTVRNRQDGPPTDLLREAVLYLDARNSVSGEQTAVNQGTMGASGNAQYGSSGSVDISDPTLLTHTGFNYFYNPATSGYANIPYQASMQSDEIDVSVRLAMDSWTPAATQGIVGRMSSGISTNAWVIAVNASNKVIFQHSDGTSTSTVVSPSSTPFTAGQFGWVRVTWRKSDGLASFYYSNDTSVPSWVSLGTATVRSGVSINPASTDPLRTSGSNSYVYPGAKYRRLLFATTIDGAAIVDVDFSNNWDHNLFVCSTGQDVTFVRPSTGLKAVVVTRPLWLFGTDDYLMVPDHASLNFTSTESFTVVMVQRQWATTNAYLLGKGTVAGGAGQGGYLVRVPSPNFQTFVQTEAVDRISSVGSTASFVGVLQTRGFVYTGTGKTLASFVDGTLATPSGALTGVSLTNTSPLYIGASLPNSTYSDQELLATLIFRKALSAVDLGRLTDYFRMTA